MTTIIIISVLVYILYSFIYKHHIKSRCFVCESNNGIIQKLYHNYENHGGNGYRVFYYHEDCLNDVVNNPDKYNLKVLKTFSYIQDIYNLKSKACADLIKKIKTNNTSD